jgi:hypothetical protein
MARINMEEIVDELDSNFSKVLKSIFDELNPEKNVESKEIMRLFRTRLERGFGKWEYVPDRCVDTDY